MPEYLDETLAKPRYVHAAFAAYLGSMSIGMALGFSSPAADELKHQFDDLDDSFFGSILTIGALIGGLLASVLGERLGRKGTILGITTVYSLGWVLILTRQNAAMLYVARFILGLACGIGCMVVPVYLSETSTSERRGVIGTGHQFNIVLGILIAYALGAGIKATPLALACFLPVVGTVIVMLFMPESPSWLVKRGRPNNEVMKSLYFLYGRTMYAEAQRELLTESKNQDSGNFALSDIVHPTVLKPLGLALSLMFIQQLTGINALIFYMNKIFDSAGTTMDPKIEAIIIAGIQVLFTVPAAIVIDRAGRRLLLHISGIVEVVGLGLLITFYIIKPHMSAEDLQHISFLPVTALSLYVAGFSVGYGPIPWLMMGELLPVRARGIGTGLCTAFNWFCAFLVTKFFPVIMKQFGDAVAYGIFIGVAIVGVIYVFLCLPETKGKSLEEIEEMFRGSSHLDESVATVESNDHDHGRIQ